MTSLATQLVWTGTLVKRLEMRPLVEPAPPPPRRELLFHEALGSVIRQKRKEKGYAVRSLATRGYVSPSHLSDVERGKKELSSNALLQVAKALDTPVSELIYAAAFELEAAEAANA